MINEKEATELDLLKERADRMGVSYHPSIGKEKLKEKIDAKMGDEPESKETKKEETTLQRNARLRKAANKLVRVNITSMNPNKKNWPGEIISVSNSVIGVIKKYIPFASEEPYHIPQALLKTLQNRKYLTFYTVNIGGKKVKRTKLIKEFSIEVLPNLTKKELSSLAAKQAASKNIEE